MKPECFKLVSDLATSPDSVLLQTTSVLKWNYLAHVEQKNNLAASHTDSTVGRTFCDCKMKMHQRGIWFTLFFKGSKSVNRSSHLQITLQNFFRCFPKFGTYCLKIDLSDIVERVIAQQCYQKNSFVNSL